MSRAAALQAALTDEPVSTSDLYDRVGYRTLVRIGLVRYQDFRTELVGLAKAGLAHMEERGEDATLWRRPAPEDATSPDAGARAA
jgi:hypothetical protein